MTADGPCHQHWLPVLSMVWVPELPALTDHHHFPDAFSASVMLELARHGSPGVAQYQGRAPNEEALQLMPACQCARESKPNSNGKVACVMLARCTYQYVEQHWEITTAGDELDPRIFLGVQLTSGVITGSRLIHQ